MGKHLDRARAHFGRDAGALLDGGRYALVHTRSLELDDLRPYVPGDDVRDIDWKATARSGHTLIKRFVSEKHHKVLVVADTGRNVSALAPSGELKRDVAANVIGAVGLITLPRSDQIGMVAGDVRGCVDIRLRRGETHVEYLLHRYHQHSTTRPAPSDIAVQLDWVAHHYRHRLLIVVVADEPGASPALGDVLDRLTSRHDVMWAMITDMPAVSSADDRRAGFDVAGGGFVFGGAELGETVIKAYRAAERQRRQEVSQFLTARGVVHGAFGGSAGIRTALTGMTEVYARAR
jgi:uncharacterized protein (DUF58 family)